MLINKEKFFTCFVGVGLILGLSGCAINHQSKTDPYENFNRSAFGFNMALDKAITRPIARAYDAVLPWPLKKGISNVFSNIGDVRSLANEILQGEARDAIADVGRIAINTTIGIGGLFDVASRMGIEKDYEDFGLTLAKWGAKETPYLVIPFIGPSTVRDAIALPVSASVLNPWWYVDIPEVRYGAYALDSVQKRANLLPGDKVVEQAFDPYVFVRDAYLQRRANLIAGNDNKRADTFVDGNGVLHKKHQDASASSIVTN